MLGASTIELFKFFQFINNDSSQNVFLIACILSSVACRIGLPSFAYGSHISLRSPYFSDIGTLTSKPLSGLCSSNNSRFFLSSMFTTCVVYGRIVKATIHGLLPVDYGLCFAAVAIVATFVGQSAVDILVSDLMLNKG